MPQTLAVRTRVITAKELVSSARAIFIRIKDKRGGGYKLEFSPKRVTIYYKVPGEAHDPGKKSQVAWVASGLEEGQRVYITAKSTSRFGYMRHECYGPIVAGKRVVYSGSPLRGPEGRSKKVVWRYNVILTTAAGKRLASYDPDVNIDKDPRPA